MIGTSGRSTMSACSFTLNAHMGNTTTTIAARVDVHIALPSLLNRLNTGSIGDSGHQ